MSTQATYIVPKNILVFASTVAKNEFSVKAFSSSFHLIIIIIVIITTIIITITIIIIIIITIIIIIIALLLIENLRQEMGWGEEKARRGQGKWTSSQTTDQDLDLLPPLF